MTPEALIALMEATWPPAGLAQAGGVVIRAGAGGGNRVSAATLAGPLEALDLPVAEAAMRALGQPLAFVIRQGDEALDALLADRGYAVKDPVIGYAAPVADLAHPRPPPVTTFQVWPPLAVQREIWAGGGIGPERLAIMARSERPGTTILGRVDDRPAGCAFVATQGDAAMVHAIEVAPGHRRRGLAAHMVRACAIWAEAQGAETLALVVTQANAGARALYASLGMVPVGHYHYRIRTEAADDT